MEPDTPTGGSPASSFQEAAAYSRSTAEHSKSNSYGPYHANVDTTNLIWIWGVVVLIGISMMAAGYIWSGYAQGAANSCNETPYSCTQDQVNGINNELSEAPILVGLGVLVAGIGVAATIFGISERLPPKRSTPLDDILNSR
jgi:hypothetical protein